MEFTIYVQSLKTRSHVRSVTTYGEIEKKYFQKTNTQPVKRLNVNVTVTMTENLNVNITLAREVLCWDKKSLFLLISSKHYKKNPKNIMKKVKKSLCNM